MTTQNEAANQFDLKGHGIHVTYSTTSLTGQPQFDYQGTHGEHTFTGEQIRTQQSELGTLVSVTLVPSIDSTRITLSILLPSFNMAGQSEQPFKTLAIQTTYAGAILVHAGARATYEVVHLHGTAHIIES